MQEISTEYRYKSADPSWSNSYLWEPLLQIINGRLHPGDRILDLGCGSGATAGMLSKLGFVVVGVDPSQSGISCAKAAFPSVEFSTFSAYDDLRSRFGQFDAVVSLEVVEHCFWPRLFAKNIFGALRPGGFAAISTPYHGYWKNLAIAIAGRFDQHWSPLWDGGHIKFWSETTMRALLDEAGFEGVKIKRVGRIPPLAKAMLAVANKPFLESAPQIGVPPPVHGI